MALVKVRKWGNSIGVVIPEEEAKKLKLQSGDTVNLQVQKIARIQELFGKYKFKEPIQKIKDELRRGWDND